MAAGAEKRRHRVASRRRARSLTAECAAVEPLRGGALCALSRGLEPGKRRLCGPHAGEPAVRPFSFWQPRAATAAAMANGGGRDSHWGRGRRAPAGASPTPLPPLRPFLCINENFHLLCSLLCHTPGSQRSLCSRTVIHATAGGGDGIPR